MAVVSMSISVLLFLSRESKCRIQRCRSIYGPTVSKYYAHRIQVSKGIHIPFAAAQLPVRLKCSDVLNDSFQRSLMNEHCVVF
jgi:hypothetical protein